MLTVDQKSRSQRFIPRVLAFACLVLGCMLSASPAKAATITIPIEISDQDILSDGVGRFGASPTSRVGLGYNTTTPSVCVLPFKFPMLPEGERIISAILSINLEGGHNLSGAPLRNIDLYGSGIVSSSSSANPPGIPLDYYVDGVNPASNPNAYLLQDNFVTPADIAGTSGGGLTIPKSSQNFGWFLQALYDNGAESGEYGFLTLTHDTALTLMRYYVFTTANGATLPKPVITLVTAATGRSYFLNADTGSDTNPGSELLPWKTFKHVQTQTQIQPGDTIYCTGELGLVDMYFGPNIPSGETAYRTGTEEKPISYKQWSGKTQPHIAKMEFHGSRLVSDTTDAHLSFEKFLFSPGKVSSASLTENVAISLKGAWHVTFKDCDIEGASLDIPENALAHVPLADRYTPYMPTSEATLQMNPAISAGASGNASFIKIQNCRIRNCGIGILVADHDAYYPPYPHPQQSHDWQILNNTIENAAEDGMRFSGADAGAGSTVRGNVIYHQQTNKAALNWYGYAYRNGSRDRTALDNKKWMRMKQKKKLPDSNGNPVYQTGIFYFTRLIDTNDGYSRCFILADSKATPALRNESAPWVGVDDPSIEFRPLGQDGTAYANIPVTGDGPHTDGLSIMGKMTGATFEGNLINSIKMENIAGDAHPTDLLFKNNIFFYSTGTTAVGGATVNVAGGKNCWFVNNTIFAGPYQNPNGCIRFVVRDRNGKKMTTDADPEGMGVHFLNNIIGGGGATNATGADPEYGHLVATSQCNLWIRPPTTLMNAGIAASASDSLPPPGPLTPVEVVNAASIARVKFVDVSIGDLRLSPDSPAINLGVSSSGTIAAPVDDFNGYSRTGIPDAGAYEAGSPTPLELPVED